MAKPRFRILQVVGIMNRGGVETMLMNHMRALDKDFVNFDFIVHTEAECDYDAEILALGGRIFHAPAIRPWSYGRYFKWLHNFFKEHGHEYAAVHAHIQENSGFALSYAKKYGIPCRVMTSHIAMLHPDFKYPFRLFARPFFKRSATHYLACGTAAGKHLYHRKPFRVIPNAMPLENFKFDSAARESVREEFGFSSQELVIGHVGRFNPQKNHGFIINAFEALAKINPHARLLLVGSGYLMDGIKRMVAEKGLDSKVVFAGNRPDVPRLLNAFDVFFMPSLFEGLPVSAIEAQANGLPCVMADTVDHETDVTGNVRFLPLKSPLAEWASALNSSRRIDADVAQKKVRDAGYGIGETVQEMLRIYGISQDDSPGIN